MSRLTITLSDARYRALKEASAQRDKTIGRRVVPFIVEQTNNTAYEEAIKLIRKVGGLMKTQKQLSEFSDYLAELRVQFKPKRNFIKLLDGVARSTAGAAGRAGD